MNVFPLLGLATLVGLLYAEWRQAPTLKWLFKPLTSLLFLLTALATGIEGHYGWWLLLGLGLCLLGDVMLLSQQAGWFLAGLLAFLMGHLAYLAAFHTLGAGFSLPPWLLLGIIAGSGVVYLWLYPYLQELRLPVLLYVAVITAMLLSAWALYFSENPSPAAPQIALGASSFYLSDLAVAIQRFRWQHISNALWGLPLYYLGQFLLALSLYNT